ncbi:MAG: dicarboxylate/amino acid:cation symporter [Bacteroidetes bacterium]|nr:dicarboxylate/amino acid:cation symporter [Bacteroidota bacterium]MCL1968925.1 dicarboxylate/amino acid:cation symporter [Bacteroidota bacterium]
MHYQIILGILLGIGFGFFFSEYVSYVDWLGELFLRALKMIVVPLVFCSVISGVANISAQDNFLRLGGKTLGFYLLTCMLAIFTGLFFVNIIKPGADVSIELPTVQSQLITALSKRDLLLNLVPDNIFQAFSSMNMIGIIIFAILFGIFLGKSEHSGAKSTKNAIEGINEVILKLTSAILALAPLGVFGIIAAVVAKDASNGEALSGLLKSQGIYLGTVFAGIGFHTFITLSVLLIVLGKINPLKHLANMKNVMLFAFSTASSNATLPLTLKEMECKSKVPSKIANFTLPLGATVNMNGTSLYECVAVIYLTQIYGLDLSFAQQLTIVFASLMVGIGSAGIPMASLVMTVVIIQMVGLPPESIGLIMLVDRFADMARTMLNVYGDTICTLLVAKNEV